MNHNVRDNQKVNLTDPQLIKVNGGSNVPIMPEPTDTCPFCGSSWIDWEPVHTGAYQGHDCYYCFHCHEFWYVKAPACHG